MKTVGRWMARFLAKTVKLTMIGMAGVVLLVVLDALLLGKLRAPEELPEPERDPSGSTGTAEDFR